MVQRKLEDTSSSLTGFEPSTGDTIEAIARKITGDALESDIVVGVRKSELPMYLHPASPSPFQRRSGIRFITPSEQLVHSAVRCIFDAISGSPLKSTDMLELIKIWTKYQPFSRPCWQKVAR
jgi:hypothetical protein